MNRDQDALQVERIEIQVLAALELRKRFVQGFPVIQPICVRQMIMSKRMTVGARHTGGAIGELQHRERSSRLDPGLWKVKIVCGLF